MLYKYKYTDDFIFTIKIDDEEIPIFNNEGIHQNVCFYINYKILYDTNFGKEHLYNQIFTDKELTYVNIDNNYFLSNSKYKIFLCYYDSNHYILIKNEEYNKLMNWFYNILTPINVLRKEKIKKIKKNINF
jgi:hypothetical protein